MYWRDQQIQKEGSFWTVGNPVRYFHTRQEAQRAKDLELLPVKVFPLVKGHKSFYLTCCNQYMFRKIGRKWHVSRRSQYSVKYPRYLSDVERSRHKEWMHRHDLLDPITSRKEAAQRLEDAVFMDDPNRLLFPGQIDILEPRFRIFSSGYSL